MPILPSPDCAFINKLAWRLAAGIAAGSALVAVALISSRPPAITPPSTIKSLAGPRPPVESPSHTPIRLGLAGNLDRCIDFCAGHVTSERSFVVFENGTCVIVDEPSKRPVIDALHTLESCSGPNAKFITREIEKGNYLVTYSRAAFHCVFSEEIDSERQSIEEGFLNFLTTAEKNSMPQGFNPPFHAKLGLVARSRLNTDARTPTVAKVIRARPAGESVPAEDSPVVPQEVPLPVPVSAPDPTSGPLKLSVTPTQILPLKDAYPPLEDLPFAVSVSVAEIVPEDVAIPSSHAPTTPSAPKWARKGILSGLAREESDSGIE